MKITLEPTDVSPRYSFRQPKVEITVETDNHDINGVLDNLIKPALIAWGFGQQTVNEAFGDEEI